MKALRFTAAEEKLELLTMPAPSPPGQGEVLVRVGFAGVCGTDLHIIKREMASAEELNLGHEFGGIVESVGSDVINVAPGDHVAIDPNISCMSCRFCARGNVNYCTGKARIAVGVTQDGGFAQYCKVPAKVAYKLPAGISARLAVLIEPYSCVLRGWEKFGQIPVDSQILVTGAGIIGLLWCSLFHYHGYRDVTVSELSDGRRKIAAECGLGFKTCSPADLDARFNSCPAEEEGFDIIVDCTGSPRAVERCFNFLRRGGKLNVFGCCPKISEMKINPAEIMLKELTIFGTLINPFTFPGAVQLVANMGDRYLSYDKLGIKEFPLEEYESALELLRSGKIAKAVFAVDASQD